MCQGKLKLPCRLSRFPPELKREIMGYLRLCDICGKAASRDLCGYCDFNCYYSCKQEQLKYSFLFVGIMIAMFKIDTTYGLICGIPVMCVVETLF